VNSGTNPDRREYLSSKNGGLRIGMSKSFKREASRIKNEIDESGGGGCYSPGSNKTEKKKKGKKDRKSKPFFSNGGGEKCYRGANAYVPSSAQRRRAFLSSLTVR